MSLISLATTLLTVRLSGVELSVRWSGVGTAVASLGGLYLAWRHLAQSDGDVRLKIVSGSLFLLLAALTIDVVNCSAGQTLARPFIDAQLRMADIWLHLDSESFIRAIVAVPGLPRLLQVAYLSSFPMIMMTVASLAITRREERAMELCNAFAMCLLLTILGSIIVPATGAFHFLNYPDELLARLPAMSGTYHLKFLLQLRAADHFVIDPGNFGGVATFPSFHTALALMTAMAWRDIRAAFIPMAIWQALVLVSTIPIGGHYFIDLAAGAACWGLAYGLCRRVASSGAEVRAWPAAPERVVMQPIAEDIPRMA